GLLKQCSFRRARTALKHLVEKGRLSPRVHDADLTAEYIDELRQHFDARVSKHSANPGRIVSPDRNCVFRIVHDGPKFQHLKAATSSDAGLSFENGAWALGPDRQRDEQH